MAIAYDAPILYDDPSTTYDGAGGPAPSTSTAGGGGNPLHARGDFVRAWNEKLRHDKGAKEERERQEEKVRKAALKKLRDKAVKSPETFEEIIADALGEDGAELLMALLD